MVVLQAKPNQPHCSVDCNQPHCSVDRFQYHQGAFVKVCCFATSVATS